MDGSQQALVSRLGHGDRLKTSFNRGGQNVIADEGQRNGYYGKYKLLDMETEHTPPHDLQSEIIIRPTSETGLVVEMTLA